MSLEFLFDQIQGTFDAGFPYCSLVLAVSIPDICATLEVEPISKSVGVRIRYVDWIKSYVGERIGVLDAEDVWLLRNGILHNAEATNKRSSLRRYIFTIGGGFSIRGGSISIDNQELMKDSRVQSLPEFLEILINAAKNWQSTNSENEIVMNNMTRLARERHDGYDLHPALRLVSGTHIIA